jgi:hypothetical protein
VAPPLIGDAVNVTDEPAQIDVVPDVMLTAGVTALDTAIVMLLLETTLLETHTKLVVICSVYTSLFETVYDV